jgi:hypothetical protein
MHVGCSWQRTDLLWFVSLAIAAKRRFIGAKGGVELVVHALRTHVSNAGLAEAACVALMGLAYDNGMRFHEADADPPIDIPFCVCFRFGDREK